MQATSISWQRRAWRRTRSRQHAGGSHRSTTARRHRMQGRSRPAPSGGWRAAQRCRQRDKHTGCAASAAVHPDGRPGSRQGRESRLAGWQGESPTGGASGCRDCGLTGSEACAAEADARSQPRHACSGSPHWCLPERRLRGGRPAQKGLAPGHAGPVVQLACKTGQARQSRM